MSLGRDSRPSPEDMARMEHEAREREGAARAGLSRGHSDRAPIDVLEDMQPGELYETLTDADVESDEFDALDDVLSPYLSASDMLAAHGDDYYRDRALKLLNENLADRVVAGRKRGDLCTGPFKRIAQELDGDTFDGERREWTPAEREAIRSTLAETRTNRQSLGDGTFLKSIMEMHVSSEVRHQRGDGDAKKGKGGSLLSILPGF